MNALIRSLLLGTVLLVPATASAGWTAGVYLGANWTFPTTLTLQQNNGPTTTWNDVHFHSRPFESPQYYGYRIGWFPSADARVGAEAEFIHQKVYTTDGALGPIVRSFAVSHGLNLLLGNVVVRQRTTSRIRLIARFGAGIGIPHGESDVLGQVQQQYEISGFALQAAAGPEFTLSKHARVFADYKLTTIAPNVSVSGGTMKGRYTGQHLAAGLGFGW